jgi:hypothetical protein
MGTEEMRALHIEAEQHDPASAEEQGEIDRLETAVAAVVDAFGIDGEPAPVLAVNEPQAVLLLLTRLIIVAEAARPSNRGPALARKLASPRALAPPYGITRIEHGRAWQPLISVIDRDHGQAGSLGALGDLNRQRRARRRYNAAFPPVTRVNRLDACGL